MAVCFHIFYPDVANEILDRLSTVKTDYGLFVTYAGGLNPLLARRMGKLDRDICFIPTENRGRDVLPFLRCLQHPSIRNFEFVVKLHTKRGWSDIGGAWREVFLRSIVGGPGNFSAILERFSIDRSLKMAGPVHTYLSAARFMYGNSANAKRVSENLLNGFWLQDWGFFAGTMFWARREVFDPLLNFEKEGLHFDDERGFQDGELAHAFERTFGLLPHYWSGKIGLLEGPPSNAMEVISGIGSPSRVAISKIITKLEVS